MLADLFSHTLIDGQEKWQDPRSFITNNKMFKGSRCGGEK